MIYVIQKIEDKSKYLCNGNEMGDLVDARVYNSRREADEYLNGIDFNEKYDIAEAFPVLKSNMEHVIEAFKFAKEFNIELRKLKVILN
jgi:hypothetical protein